MRDGHAPSKGCRSNHRTGAYFSLRLFQTMWAFQSQMQVSAPFVDQRWAERSRKTMCYVRTQRDRLLPLRGRSWDRGTLALISVAQQAQWELFQPSSRGRS